MITVNIWWPDLKGNIGHGSMDVQGTYISNWPGELSSVFLTGRGQANELRDDVSAEKGPPNCIIHITGLDEAAILRWWQGFLLNPRYSIWYLNCMQTVGTGLCIGSPNPLHTRYLAWAYCLHHFALYKFANGLAVSPSIAGIL